MRPYYKELPHIYRQETLDGGLHKTAGDGGNLYYCTKYMAPLHKDEDITTSLCSQLEKRGYQDRELDFCYAQFGIYIQTQANMKW